jgi:hypothetical protein
VARRLRVLATLREHPEITDVPIPPILYITGLERSGTTLLHNVLALHPDARAFRRWELMEPVPPPEAATASTDPRIGKVQAAVDRLRGSALEAMHWVNADEPEECVWGYVDAVSMLGQSACLCMPAWRRVLFGTDLSPAFRRYRQVVQLLLWKHPVPPGGFLVLKAPQVAGSIGSVAATFPEARFVITDRDPFRCMVSMAALGEAVVDPFCIENPLTDDGRRARMALEFATVKLEAVSSFTTSAPGRVVHVPYPALVAHPAAVAEQVLEGFPAPAVDLGPAVDGFLAAQRAGGRASPPSDLGAMGYEHGAVWADPVIHAYCERFGIVPERTRLTGVAAPG